MVPLADLPSARFISAYSALSHFQLDWSRLGRFKFGVAVGLFLGATGLLLLADIGRFRLGIDLRLYYKCGEDWQVFQIPSRCFLPLYNATSTVRGIKELDYCHIKVHIFEVGIHKIIIDEDVSPDGRMH